MGVKIVQNNSNEILAGFLRMAEQLPETLAQQIAQEAKALCPVDTGDLRDSIHVEDSTVVVDSPYAAYVEYGNHRMAGRPFLTPAFESALQRAADEARKLR